MHFPAVRWGIKSAWTRVSPGVRELVCPHAVSVKESDKNTAVHVSLKKGLSLPSVLAFNEKKIFYKVLYEMSPEYICIK